MADRGSNRGSRGTGIRRGARLVAAAAGLALVGGVAMPAAAGAQGEDGEFGSVAECFAADEGLGDCIDLFLAEAPTTPTLDNGDEDDENRVGFDPAALLPGIFGADED